jgi:hemerythrin-like domain-containing protein
MPEPRRAPRRRALVSAGLCGAGGFLAACAALAKTPAHAEPEAEDVTPVEDLMREHGVLRRVLIVYDEIGRRIVAGVESPPDALARAAGLVKRFVEGYHERSEEERVFPVFERARVEADLVAVLRCQHEAGRRTTGVILELAKAASSPGSADAARLADALASFARMYRAHAAREDTVLFPALRGLVGARAYADLGEAFEDEEHRRFGPRGFEDAVAEVAELEAAVGVGDLARFGELGCDAR